VACTLLVVMRQVSLSAIEEITGYDMKPLADSCEWPSVHEKGLNGVLRDQSNARTHKTHAVAKRWRPVMRW
jgi:hypothetical protein